MSNTRDPLGWYSYQDDRGIDFKVRLTESVGTASGMAAITDELSANYRPLPFSSLKMRHVYIRTPDHLHSDRIPMAARTSLKYKNGGTIANIAGQPTWIITGRKGESKTFT